MKKIMTFWLAAFGSGEDFLQTRQGAEATFWQQSRGSVWKAARQWPDGKGWWYLAKRFFLRQIVPPVLIFGVTVTLLFAGFGGWIASQENRDVKAQTEARKQALEAFEQRVEKAKEGGGNHGEK